MKHFLPLALVAFLAIGFADDCQAQAPVGVTHTFADEGEEAAVTPVEFYCHPNPTNGRLVVTVKHVSGNVVVRLRNNMGNVVDQATGFAEDHFQHVFMMENYEPGFYYVQLTTSQGMQYQTVLRTL